ncbi:hypothetical protein N7493_010820 [Penicillium malachiteum]|uniref:Major facilitator superfamily (MFS) profile domain-containing protein n=1 Tax=Penicillium malachiteum TaxID=1324776 RepID=A0AAD6HDI6_9EURO|nr:hypothetical protein N7493_010820 [Penicillium malachiteum]
MTRRNSDDSKSETKHFESNPNADYPHDPDLEKAGAVTNMGDIAASIDDIPVSWYVWLVALTASTAGLLFGYDTGVISGATTYMGSAFFGAIFAGTTADRFGRKTSIYLGCALFIIGAVLQGAAFTIAQMAVGRIVVGFGVGAAAMVLPLYVAEIAPAMVGLGAVPAIILAALLPFCPESPRHLVYKSCEEEARVILQKIYKGASELQIDAVQISIRGACDQAREINESASAFGKMKQLHLVPSNLRALIVACGLMVISQLSGFNGLMYYSGTIFGTIGFKDPMAVGLVVAGTNFVMTIVNALVIDKVAVAFHWIPFDLSSGTLESTNGISAASIALIIFVIWFVVFYGVSVGNTAWMSTDFFPLEVRAMGTMWLTCSSWGSNVIVSSCFLSMIEKMTPSGAFGFFAGICGLGWIWIYFFYPETSGLLLEEVQEIFECGFGVKYARNLRRERKELIEERLRSQDKPMAMGH